MFCGGRCGFQSEIRRGGKSKSGFLRSWGSALQELYYRETSWQVPCHLCLKRKQQVHFVESPGEVFVFGELEERL